jgi:hypothetical protein
MAMYKNQPADVERLAANGADLEVKDKARSPPPRLSRCPSLL